MIRPRNILAAATRDRVSVSAWMTIAVREAPHRRAGLAAVAQWQMQHGPFTAEEIEEARRTVREAHASGRLLDSGLQQDPGHEARPLAVIGFGAGPQFAAVLPS